MRIGIHYAGVYKGMHLQTNITDETSRPFYIVHANKQIAAHTGDMHYLFHLVPFILFFEMTNGTYRGALRFVLKMQ